MQPRVDGTHWDSAYVTLIDLRSAQTFETNAGGGSASSPPPASLDPSYPLRGEPAGTFGEAGPGEEAEEATEAVEEAELVMARLVP